MIIVIIELHVYARDVIIPESALHVRVNIIILFITSIFTYYAFIVVLIMHLDIWFIFSLVF